MTETPRPPEKLTPERLEEIRLFASPSYEIELAELFQHIDALSAALQEARAERDGLTAEVAELKQELDLRTRQLRGTEALIYNTIKPC